jgi:hypothetical protein
VNLFVLDPDPKLAAIYHTDRHIVKMPTETAQMISFVYHDPELWTREVPDCIMGFSKTHYKHPCSIWIRESLSNFKYACEFGMELYREYQYRYQQPDKHQRAKKVFQFALENLPSIQDIGLTKFATAMDEQFIVSDPIDSYRAYYRDGKKHLHNWKNRNKPHWI